MLENSFRPTVELFFLKLNFLKYLPCFLKLNWYSSILSYKVPYFSTYFCRFSILTNNFPGSNNEQDRSQDLFVRLLPSSRHRRPRLVHLLGQDAASSSDDCWKVDRRQFLRIRRLRFRRFRKRWSLGRDDGIEATKQEKSLEQRFDFLNANSFLVTCYSDEEAASKIKWLKISNKKFRFLSVDENRSCWTFLLHFA